jgi:hypothetical protein
MRHLLMATAVLAASSAGSSFAQEEAGQFRTAVSVVGGLSVGSSHSIRFANGRGVFAGFGGGSETGFAVGGSVAHDLTPRITLEATGLYLDRNASAWSADAGVRLNLMPSRESIVPYFAVSGGLYGESGQTVTLDGIGLPEDLRGGRGFQTGGGFPAPIGGGRGQRPPVTIGRGEPPTITTSHSSSTDGLLTLGGGVTFAAGPHVFVRPDARAQLVFAGDNRVLGLFTINFGYRF